MSGSNTIDTSSLAWVLGEIRNSLQQSTQALQTFAQSADGAQLRIARSGLHQAHGALQIVGVDGVSILTEEVEQLYEQFESDPKACTEGARETISKAFQAVVEYLEELQRGVPHHPVRLFPYFKELLLVRGADRIHPADLFFPDLSLRPAKSEPQGALTQELLSRERARFERGLLYFLRDRQNLDAVQSMLNAVTAIEATQRASAQRTFWWVTKAFLEALQANALPADLNVQRLCARINLQMRRLLDESAPIAERLLKDTLFFVARAHIETPTIQQVKALFRLDGLVPEDFETAKYGKTDAHLLSQTRERLEAAKQAWNRLVSGSNNDAHHFANEVNALQNTIGGLHQPGLAELSASLASIAQSLQTSAQLPGENLGLEVATSLLLLEGALDNLATLDEQFNERTKLVAQRLEVVAAGQTPTEHLDWLDEISRHAQERLSLLSVIREIQNGLIENEKVIDNFFRDPTQRADLAGCQPALSQISGAFTLLGQPAAVELVKNLQTSLEQFTAAENTPDSAVLEAFAQQYGALGFLTETLSHHPETSHIPYEFDERTSQFKAPERPRPFNSLTLFGQTVSADDEDDDDLSFVAHTPVVNETVTEENSQESVSAVSAEDNAARILPPPVLPSAGSAKGLVSFVDAVTTHSIPLPTIPTAAIPDSQQAIDAELLEIFLGEAEEVLATIREASAASEALPNDQEQLTLIRRGFHTLKGSSRMVGLSQFGEAAWGLEQTLNAWLSEQRSATPDLLSMINYAHDELGAWVKDLQQHGRSERQPQGLVELARQVRAGEAVTLPATTTVDSATQVGEPSLPDVPSIAAEFVEPLEVTASPAEESSSVEYVSELSAAPITENVEEELVLDLSALELPSLELDATPDPVHTEPEAAVTETTQAPISAEVISLVPPEPVSAARDETVYVGDMPVSAPLYNIFLTEADELVRQLERDFAEWRHEARPVSFLAQRSVHSLAGIAGTVGFKHLRNLAVVLEDCLGLMANQQILPEPSDLACLDAVTEHIRGMLQQFAAGVLPPAADEWLTQLHAWQDALNKSAQVAPPVIEAAPLSDAEGIELESEVDLRTAALLEESLSTIPVEPLAPAATTVPIEPIATRVEYNEPAIKATDEVPDDIDAELLPVFIEEASDYLPQIGATLRNWQANPNDNQNAQSLLRQLHTIKGSARMAGAMRLGQLIHEIESRVEALAPLPTAPLNVLDELLNAHDQSLHLFDQLTNPTAPVSAEAVEAALDDTSFSPAPIQDANVTLTPILQPQSFMGVAATTLAAAPASNLPQTQAQVRVRADLLDRLVNQAGEVSISRARVENEISSMRGALTDLTENVSRLRAQLREIEIQAESEMQSQLSYAREHEGQFDPLEFDRFTRLQELTRMMAESVNDVSSLQTNLVKGVEKAQEGLLIQARNTRELQQDLMSVRMVQFGSISERLYRVVRQAAKELDKRVNLDIRGANVELDRGVLERMVGPFEHLLRNAVVHGIESRADRLGQNKSETGELLIEVRQEGGEVVLTFGDDGAGLNVERIRARALSQGLLNEERDITDREATEFIFTPGFSTAGEVTELAGRGVGMDVVKFEAAELGGRVSLDFTPGQGSRFTIHLPLTLAVTQVVLIRVGEKIFALPSVLVEQVQQLKPQALANAYNAGHVEWLGEKVAVRYLATLLGDLRQTPMAQRYSPLIVLRSGIQRLALHVDEIVGNQEAVVKNMGPQLARVPGIAGATVMGSGEIVLILNPVQLAERQGEAVATPNLLTLQEEGSVGAVAEHSGRNQTTAVQGLNTTPTIMVVDDSLTVRRVTQRLLQREGYQVVLAKDGVDALQQVQEMSPDVMLVDIEMPRMDGFDLTRNIRSDERLKNVPIIMITSRTAEKHRNYALSIGVNIYLGKPYQETELLQHIGEFVGERKPKAISA